MVADLTVEELARHVARGVGFRGELAFDTAKPDGIPRKLLDSARLAQLAWRATTALQNGLGLACEDYLRASSSAKSDRR